jgi:hypothetical protein
MSYKMNKKKQSVCSVNIVINFKIFKLNIYFAKKNINYMLIKKNEHVQNKNKTTTKQKNNNEHQLYLNKKMSAIYTHKDPLCIIVKK